jgi:hypothetical protein
VFQQAYYHSMISAMTFEIATNFDLPSRRLRASSLMGGQEACLE